MPSDSDVVLCLSHLRWNFVYQRPQHLLSRCARDRPVVFFEEPELDREIPELDVRETPARVRVVTPHLPRDLSPERTCQLLRRLVDSVLADAGTSAPILWYYTPLALGFTDHLRPIAVVYDCMDELSLFHGAPAELAMYERRLLQRADVVFTGGYGLYEHKRHLHRN